MKISKFLKSLAGKDTRLIIRDKRNPDVSQRDTFWESELMMKGRQKVMDDISSITLGYREKNPWQKSKKEMDTGADNTEQFR